MLLYKYRELKEDDEEAFARLEAILRNQSFWCARPDTLNDDQEFSWRCDYQPTADTTGLFAALLSRERNKPFADAWVQVEPLIASNAIEHIAAHVIAGIIQKCRAEIGLLCLGKSQCNATLWSRYGGSGQGVCIEIDVPDRLLNSELFEVKYEKEKIVHIDELLRGHLGDAKAVYTLALLTKPESWRDEDEIRFISSKQNVYVQISSSRISSIYLGCALSGGLRQRIENLSKALLYGPKVHQMPSA